MRSWAAQVWWKEYSPHHGPKPVNSFPKLLALLLSGQGHALGQHKPLANSTPASATGKAMQGSPHALPACVAGRAKVGAVTGRWAQEAKQEGRVA